MQSVYVNNNKRLNSGKKNLKGGIITRACQLKHQSVSDRNNKINKNLNQNLFTKESN